MEPEIYTTYFGNLRKLPKDIIPISIALKSPDWYKGFQYKKLAPKYGFFSIWKRNHDNDYYAKCFNEQVLSLLDAKSVCDEIYNLTGSNKIALVCYEKPSDFCHRHLVRNWFLKNGISIKEF